MKHITIILLFYSLFTVHSKTIEIFEYSYALKEDDNKFYFKAKYYFCLREDIQYCMIFNDSTDQAFKIQIPDQMLQLPDFSAKTDKHQESISHYNIVRMKNISAKDEIEFSLFDLRNEEQRVWYEKLIPI